MHGIRRLALVLGLALVATPCFATSRPIATSFRAGPAGSATEVAVGFSEIPRYRVFTLVGPDRVVIDLDEVDFRLPDGWHGGGAVKAMRCGLFQPGTSRIVLDMGAPNAVATVGVNPGPAGAKELVLKLVPISAADAAGRSGQVVASTLPVSLALASNRLPPVKPQPGGTAKMVIAIDPGHGGIDPGTVGAHGTYEKAVTLALAREMKARLERDPRIKVVLTRNGDQFLQLRDRIAIARRAGAQLFISLHADSHPDSSFRGASVYTLSEDASDAEAAALAAKENKADVIAGVDLSKENEVVTSILIDLAQRETKNLSAQFAAMLVDELGRQTALIRHTHRFAGFAVLKAPDVASVLIETGYLSNLSDEKLLLSPAYRAKLSEAVARAVDDYFDWQESLKRS